MATQDTWPLNGISSWFYRVFTWSNRIQFLINYVPRSHLQPVALGQLCYSDISLRGLAGPSDCLCCSSDTSVRQFRLLSRQETPKCGWVWVSELFFTSLVKWIKSSRNQTNGYTESGAGDKQPAPCSGSDMLNELVSPICTWSGSLLGKAP